jgi:hypothetical protein
MTLARRAERQPLVRFLDGYRPPSSPRVEMFFRTRKWISLAELARVDFVLDLVLDPPNLSAPERT